MRKKRALITGITGQDGGYLAEFLLNKGYEVYGMYRRSSLNISERLGDLTKKINLVEGDLTDLSSLVNIIRKTKPGEVYNLASQSFVPASWTQPIATAEITGLGVANILEAIKLTKPDLKYYQASSSEMFGKVQEVPQTEKTPFYPRSPYGIAKVFGYWTTINYRESYGIFACNGILFNHESIPKNSPLILMDEEGIDILPIEDLFKIDKHKYEGILDEYIGKFVWNGESWTKLINGTCYQNKNKPLKLIQTRNSCYEATHDHISFLENNLEIKTNDLKIGNKMFKTDFPMGFNFLDNNLDFVRFIGFIAGDGYISEEGRIRITGTKKQDLLEIFNLIKNIYNWSYRLSSYGPGKYPNCSKNVWNLDINNDRNFGKWLRENIYTKRSFEKKVPRFILNANKEIKKAFFDGYYLADGRKKGNETYEYKGFTSSSSTLTLGLIKIFKELTNQNAKVKCELKNGKRYYYTQFDSGKITNKGKHLKKEMNEVIKISNTKTEDGWFYDIQTESQTFATGPNLFKVHNSPKRGKQFVTRKISHSVSKIKLGHQDFFELGNLDSQRDWGYAGDYVEAMWLMLQQDKPNDYVIATGETHSVRKFVEESFKVAGIPIVWEGRGIKEVGKCNGKTVVKLNSKFFRPAEVDLLVGNPEKAKKELGWEPKIKFKELVKMMIESDLKRLQE